MGKGFRWGMHALREASSSGHLDFGFSGELSRKCAFAAVWWMFFFGSGGVCFRVLRHLEIERSPT